VIATVEHQVGTFRRFKLGVGTVLADQQIGRAPDIEIRTIATPGRSSVGVTRPGSPLNGDPTISRDYVDARPYR
jgi:hypothetical protein